MPNKIYIGIDPGVSGALAVINNDNIEIVPYDELQYRAILRNYSFLAPDVVCCIEQVHSMPKQGVASTFTFGKNFGILLGMLVAYDLPYQEIKPQKWKKEFSLIGKDKAASIEVAHHLYPSVSLKRTDKCKIDHDGMAEALLMATYAKRKLC